MVLRFHVIALVTYLFCARANAQFWTTAYYPGNSESALPVSEIDFKAVSHVIHFAAIPSPDGSLNLAANNVRRDCADALVSHAHAAGKQVLICVGGAESEAAFRQAASPVHRQAFVSNLVSLVRDWNYDGIDLDWEPLAKADFPEYTNLVRELRAGINAGASVRILTAAASAYPIYGDPADSEYAMFASVQDSFDQINVMTYDLSGPYDGWISWFNSPVYDGGCRFASTGSVVPSLDGAVRSFIRKGVHPAKLGVGIPFYGDVWTGSVSGPRQSWKTPPIVKQISYTEIMASYFQTNLYHWDNSAQAAYLSMDPPGGATFVSYDDEQSCRAKVGYARSYHLGGVMIWHLAHGHRADQPPDKRDPLLEAVRQAVAVKDTASNKAVGEDSN